MMKTSIQFLAISFIFLINPTLAGEVKPAVSSSLNEQDTWSYTVTKNDSFERIYQKYMFKHADILTLSQLNQHKLSKKIQPNQVLIIPVEMLKKVPTNAEVLVANGDVMAMTLIANQKRKVNKGDVLNADTTLVTGKNGLAKIRFADGSITNLQSNSSLSIQASFQYAGKGTHVVQLKLAQGRTDEIANPNHQLVNRMQIETPSAVAAVRGTEFRVGAEGDIASQERLEGQVGFSTAGQEVLLAKGFGSAVEKDKAPLPPILLPAAPGVSAFDKHFGSVPVEFNLTPQAEAVAYISQLALDADFTQILNEQVIQSTKLSFDHLADGRYYLRLRAQEQHGLQGKDAIHVFNVKLLPPPPPPPELVEPLDEAVIPLAPTMLSWIAIPLANSYLVQIARDVNFENKIFERIASFNQLTITNSFGAGQFYWRVPVLNAGKPQKFSNYRKFTR